MQNKLLILLTAFALSFSTNAATIEQPLADSMQEATARALFHELRCVVCEGQTIADSDAALATQMRATVRKQLATGQSKGDVLAFFRAHYGDQILMTPPVKRHTALLWLAPLLLVGAGGALLWRTTHHTPKDRA